MTEPAVSVVVICFNDAARVGRAIASVQRQTLRALEIIVVDDASTDDTEQVVRAIADRDPRVRYERLAQNSGGCSAPRNRGLEISRAPWVMFCDSDDEYERHGCKNLLQVAERTGADVVCGTAERVDVASGRRRRWRPEVHETVRVEDGLEAFPELVYDTISVNKIYRRAMLVDAGIAFPEGLLFEDQLFTLEAFAAAHRVAAIPETVYLWYVDRLSDEPSITQRRHEVRNVESRIEVNRRIDAFLDERGLTGIRRLKDLKFLRHDLYLYLSSILEADDDTARALMERLRPYVAASDLAPAWELRPALRVAIYHLLVDDLDGVRAAMSTLRWASVVGAPVVAQDGRERWACEHLADGPSVAGVDQRTWLDVTDLHVLDVPFTQRRYLHVVDALTAAGDVVTATGSTVDFDGSLASVDRVELRFIVGADRTAMTVPAEWTTRDGATWHWRAQGAPVAALPRDLEAKDHGSVALALVRDEHASVITVRARQAQVPEATIGFPGAGRGSGPDSVVLEPLDNGAVGWRAARMRTRPRGAAAWRAWWFRLPGTTALARLTADAMPGLVQRFGALLPTRSLAVFESESGRAVSGEPRAISERMHDLHPRIAQAWVRRSAFEEVPAFAEAVERYSLRHQWLLVRARYWVDDGTSPLTVRRPRRARAVMTGTGVPIARQGLDDPSILVDRSATREVRRRAERTSIVLTPSEQTSPLARSALGFRGPVVATGLARADRVLPVRATDAATRDLRRALDLPADRRIVLYTPARRTDPGEGTNALLDLQRWSDALGAGTYLLLHAERPDRFDVPSRLRHAVRDASGGDLDLLLAASDLLLADYGPVIGEAALVDVPVVLYQPDRTVFVGRTHGVYGGAAGVGPVVETVDGLVESVAGWLREPTRWEEEYAAGRRAFAATHCGPADGDSSTRAVGVVVDGAPAANPKDRAR